MPSADPVAKTSYSGAASLNIFSEVIALGTSCTSSKMTSVILGSDPSSGLDRQCGNQPFHTQIRIKQHTHVGIVEKCDTTAIRKVLDNL